MKSCIIIIIDVIIELKFVLYSCMYTKMVHKGNCTVRYKIYKIVYELQFGEWIGMFLL